MVFKSAVKMALFLFLLLRSLSSAGQSRGSIFACISRFRNPTLRIEKKISKPLILLLVLATISLLIVSLTLYAYYRSSLLHFSGTLDKEFFPAFGSFIGGTVGLILSMASVILIYSTYQTQQKQLEITRSLVDRQISLSVKPDLVVEEFRSTRSPMEQVVATNLLDGIFPRNLQTVNVKILNIGIEAAKYIEYSFYYNIDDLLAYYADKIENKTLEFGYTDENHVVSVKIPGMGAVWGFAVISEQKIVTRDYLLPYKLNSDYFEAAFPISYLIFYYHMMS